MSSKQGIVSRLKKKKIEEVLTGLPVSSSAPMDSTYSSTVRWLKPYLQCPINIF